MAKRSRETSFSPPADELSASDTYENLSDVELGRANKYKLVDNSPAASSISIMQCSLPPHQDSLQFQSHDDYEVHYLKEHTNRCSSCGKNFPTAHLLGLHIEENHNALRETLQAKGEKTYACFVEDCERKCSTPQKRRLHLIDKHGFPKVSTTDVFVVASWLIIAAVLQFSHSRQRDRPGCISVEGRSKTSCLAVYRGESIYRT